VAVQLEYYQSNNYKANPTPTALVNSKALSL